MTDEQFLQLVTGSLRNIREVKDFAIVGTTVQVVLDFGALNSFVEGQLDRLSGIWRYYEPNAAIALIPYEENYKTRFPFTEAEYRLGGRAALAPGVVATVVGVEEVKRLTGALDKTD